MTSPDAAPSSSPSSPSLQPLQPSQPAPPPLWAQETLRADEAYTASLVDFVLASPTSYHAAAEVARRLATHGFHHVEEARPWQEDLPRHGYVVRDGAVAAWILPSDTGRARSGLREGFRVVGAHTDSPALRLKPSAAVARHGWQLINVEVYGGPLLPSLLDRELGLAGRLTTRDGTSHLVRTGPVARIAHVAPHLDRSVNEALRLERQTHLLPLWALSGPDGGDGRDAVEEYLCELAGLDRSQLAGHDILTFPVQPPQRFGREGEFLASSRLDNLSSVHAGLVALEALAESGTEPAGPVVLVAFDHEEVGSATASGADGPLLATLLERLGRVMGAEGDAFHALVARSSCVSADAGHAVHPARAELHDPVLQPLVNSGPLLKINAQQRYATGAQGSALWERACAAADVPHQVFVSHNAVPCGSTIGPLTATRLGLLTVDVGVPLLSMHSAREMGGVKDGPWLARALYSYWQGA
ncbi:M18 family aminopeptidase [Actinomyces wuliandei]|uniref:M18 family aminopeptidase n=1 Tax=Actinomyces wuliandei TaxID=2057743 RepID=UPI000FD897BD|nr:M18 family aminopeptidase [Actinomyces wuliandei]